ncbi:MAG: hypothetical protein ACFFC6_15580 [Promethearchaeota archaeon]
MLGIMEHTGIYRQWRAKEAWDGTPLSHWTSTINLTLATGKVIQIMI